jgi:hypothetical protein
LDLLFEPEFERVAETGSRDAMFVSTHQMFGSYSGRITPNREGPILVRGLFGWIEDHEARW